MNAHPSFFVIGGTLGREAPSYIRRAADDELLAALEKGELAYILTSRQMGKSSLMVRTAARLKEQGVRVAVLDLTAVGQNLSLEQWYFGLLDRLGRSLDLEDELEDYWEEHRDLGPLQRWTGALEDVALSQAQSSLVIFVDEIDAVRSLPFSTDEFFAALRELYTRRVTNPELHRLSFALLGVATPSDLIQDPRTTPFNIGKRIQLSDFSLEELHPFSEAMAPDPALARALLKRIHHWTGGQPYLTQRLCRAVAEDASIQTSKDIDRLTEELFTSKKAQNQDDNLLFVRDRILRSGADVASLLDLYQKIRMGKKVADEETLPLLGILKLSGLVVAKAGWMRVRNAIYREVFNLHWIRSNMPDAEIRRQKAAYRKGTLKSALIAGGIAAIFAILAILAWRNLEQAQSTQAELLSQKGFISLEQKQFRRAALEWTASLRLNPNNPDTAENLMAVLYHLAAIPKFDISDTITVDLSPDGKQIITAERDYILRIWNVETGHQVAASKKLHFYPIWIKTLKRGYIVRGQNGCYFWDGEPGNPLQALPEINDNDDRHPRYFVGHDPWIVYARGQQLWIWNINDRPMKAIKLPTNMPHEWRVGPVFSRDGRILTMSNITHRQPWIFSMARWEVGSWIPMAGTKGYSLIAPEMDPRGRYISVAPTARILRILDLDTGKSCLSPMVHASSISNAIFTRDGASILSFTSAGDAILWDVANGRKKAECSGLPDTSHGISLTDDPLKAMAKGYRGDELCIQDFSRSPSRIRPSFFCGVFWNQENERIGPGGYFLSEFDRQPNRTFIWKARFVKQETPDIQAENSWRYKLAAAGSHLMDGKSMSNRIRIEETDNIASIDFSPNGNLVATATTNGTIRVWCTDVGTQIGQTIQMAGMPSWIRISPNGQTVLCKMGTKEVHLIDTFGRNPPQKLIHDTLVLTGNFSPDGMAFVTTSVERPGRIWSTSTGELLTTLQSGQLLPERSHFSIDGSQILSFSSYPYPNVVSLWDAKTGKLLQRSDQCLPSKNNSNIIQNTLHIFNTGMNKFSASKLFPNIKINGPGLNSNETFNTITISKDASYALINDSNSKATNNIQLWKTEPRMALIQNIKGDGPGESSFFLRDGRSFFTIHPSARRLQAWDSKRGQLLFSKTIPEITESSNYWSPLPYRVNQEGNRLGIVSGRYLTLYSLDFFTQQPPTWFVPFCDAILGGRLDDKLTFVPLKARLHEEILRIQRKHLGEAHSKDPFIQWARLILDLDPQDR